jgi:uncharacterized protein YegL
LNTAIEKSIVGYTEEANLLSMASIKSPVASGMERPSLDLVVVADRSGSMRGDKMKLLVETLQVLLDRALTARDRFSLVTFDHTVNVDVPLTAMDANGNAYAKKIIAKLCTGGATNLSGGLLKAIDILGQSMQNAETRTRAVMLFTDGLANNGITETSELVRAVSGGFHSFQISACCYTFGFGVEHNEDMLRAISDSTRAQYYYIQSVDDISTSFADCLGGLVSVVAQNATLLVEGVNGTRIDKVLGHYKVIQMTSSTVIDLGDLYSQDEKDLLFEICVAKAPFALTEASPVLEATLRYFSVANARMEEVSSTLEMLRPTHTPDTQSVNLELDEQRNRIRVAQSMEAAVRAADSGRVDEGRDILMKCKEIVEASPSADASLSTGLIHEVKQLAITGYSDVPCYRSLGAKMTKMHAMSHMQQRTNHLMPGLYTSARAEKAIMKEQMTREESLCMD